LAEAAGVTRLTVYRHFPAEDELFDACRRHWIVRHPPPDPDAWRTLPPLEERARRALADLYAWYGAHREALYPLYRDFTAMPTAVQRSMQAADARTADALIDGSGLRGNARRRLRAAAGHVVSYWTWSSLSVDQGLDHHEAVCLAVRLLTAAGADCADGPA
jgi:AcrR family transcriptional regulator